MRKPRGQKGSGKPWHGAKWCRPSKRWAIYARDRFTCVYCGATSDLSLDHVLPEVLGGTHAYENLVTSCMPCNRARGARTMRSWLAYLRARGASTDGLARRVRAATRRRVDRALGLRLARSSRRG